MEVDRKELLKFQLEQEVLDDNSQELRDSEMRWLKETSPTPTATFSFAAQLSRSNNEKLLKKAIELLADTLRLETRDKSMRRDCVYYIAKCHFKLEEYEEARTYVNVLLKLEPQNEQGHAMKALIEDNLTKDGLLGVAIIGGITAVLGATAILAAKAFSKK